jgi:hypothetical protein
MSKFKEKAEAQTMQVIGQMIGDDQLVEEGKEQSRKAEAGFDEPLPSGKTRLHTMPKENDLEGAQDQGGKHGGQKGMPKPEPRPAHGKDQGIMRDERGQEQPRDKERAQHVSRVDKGGDPPGKKNVKN